MKLKWGLTSLLFVLLFITSNSLLQCQTKHTGIKAYLIFKNNSEIIKDDSLFEKKLRTRLASLLKKGNIILVSNEEMETSEQLNWYIYVNLNDSLRISAKESGSADMGVITVPQKEKVYSYCNKKDIIKKVLAYSKKNLLKH